MRRISAGNGRLRSLAVFVLPLLFVLFGLITARAQPAQIAIQGLLTNAGGTPIAGTVNMTVRLYADSLGGAPFFTEVHSSTPLSGGVYNIRLGTISNLHPDTFAKKVWMGIQVNADPEIMPRTLFTAAPAAMTLVLPTDLVGTASNYGGTTLVVQNLATTGQNYALTALSESPNGRALYGYATHMTGLNYGVYGLSRSSTGVGIRGRNSATSGATIGVEGVAESTSGASIGVKGVATESSSGVGVRGEGGTIGVDGWSLSTGGRFVGATGINVTGSSLGGRISGLDGLKVSASSDSHPDLILGGLNELYSAGRIVSDPTITSSSIELKSNSGVDIVLDNAGTTALALFRLLSPTGTILQVDELGNMNVAGALIVTGAKNAQVETPSYGNRLVYSIESPEVWFEDFGTATLDGGSIRIDLEQIFLETVTIGPNHPLKVFLQPADDTPGLYVQKDATGFNVFERSGGSGSVTFDYRIVAKRRGFEDERLENGAPL